MVSYRAITLKFKHYLLFGIKDKYQKASCRNDTDIVENIPICLRLLTQTNTVI